MDWIAKSSFQWDWETLALFSGKECEISKPVEESHWRIDGGMDIGNGSLYSSGGACSGSDLGNLSSRSSLSASIDSSKKIGGRMSELNFDSVQRDPVNLNENGDLPKVEDSGTSPVLIAADGLSEPIIGLKLGKRTYFEDACAGNNIKNLPSTSVPTATVSVKKPRVSQQNTQSIYCQVEGCKKDLTTAKEYHRKHRVCESHSKSAKVVVAGLERRFCQQCSRFHGLSEFDQKKRSCRRRLSDHNARRRKPQPETISFSSSVSSQSYYGDKQQVNLVFGRAPFSHLTTTTSTAWDFSGGFKVDQIKDCKLGGNAQHQTFPNIGLSNNFSTIHHDGDRLLPFKGTTAEVRYQDLEAPTVASNMDGAPDLRRALSLLSTDSVCAANLGLGSNFQSANTNNVTAAHPSFHLADATTSFWQEEPPPEKVLSFHPQNSSLQYQEFQLHKSQYDTGFFGAYELQ